MSRSPLTDDAKRFLRDLGETIRAARREAGLKQAQAGARVGIDDARWGEVERGAVDTSVSRVRAMARAVGVPLAALLRRVDVAGRDDRAVEAMRERLREAIRGLAADDLDLLAAIVRRLVRRG